MRLLQRYLKQEVPTLNQNNIRLGYIGRQHELPPEVQDRMQWAREATAHNSGMALTLALNYSARSEIVDAVNAALAAATHAGNGRLPLEENDIARHLYTRHLPELDFIIRTSGEMRLSNFLLWQVAYAEIHVTPTLWPDFRGANLLQAIAEYQKRERRYGGLTTHDEAAPVLAPAAAEPDHLLGAAAGHGEAATHAPFYHAKPIRGDAE
jgi:undecaprenyl diphosphate synthase